VLYFLLDNNDHLDKPLLHSLHLDMNFQLDNPPQLEHLDMKIQLDMLDKLIYLWHHSMLNMFQLDMTLLMMHLQHRNCQLDKLMEKKHHFHMCNQLDKELEMNFHEDNNSQMDMLMKLYLMDNSFLQHMVLVMWWLLLNMNIQVDKVHMCLHQQLQSLLKRCLLDMQMLYRLKILQHKSNLLDIL